MALFPPTLEAALARIAAVQPAEYSRSKLKITRLCLPSSLAEARLRSVRASRVSRPWMVLASQRCRQASVFGPVLRPPCVLRTRLLLRGGAAHWVAVTLKGVYVSKIGLAVRATPTDGATPTPLGGPLGGSKPAIYDGVVR